MHIAVGAKVALTELRPSRKLAYPIKRFMKVSLPSNQLHHYCDCSSPRLQKCWEPNHGQPL